MNRARSPVVLTNPVAEASAFVELSPGIAKRRPNGTRVLYPVAIGASDPDCMSGVVAVRPQGAMILRVIKAA